MPVERIDEYRCFRCKRLKGPLNHWWLVRIVAAEWTFRDFAAHALEQFDYAVCSMECLITEASEHAAKFLNLRGPDLAEKPVPHAPPDQGDDPAGA